MKENEKNDICQSKSEVPGVAIFPMFGDTADNSSQDHLPAQDPTPRSVDGRDSNQSRPSEVPISQISRNS